MQRLIFIGSISALVVVTLVFSGCSGLINTPMPNPSITAIIVTSVPPQVPLPTLTSLPLLPSATLIAPSTTPAPTLTDSPIPKPSTTPQVIAAAPTATLQPPPPPPPTQVILPQLPVFDKDGNNMEGKALGTTLAKTYMSFQVVVCSPDCKNKPDGSGVTSVDFEFYKGTTQFRADLDGKKPVYKTTEHNKPYCAFGGNSPCPLWIFSEHGNKWPNGATIDNGDYTLLLRAFGDNKNNAFWTSVINFTIQR